MNLSSLKNKKINIEKIKTFGFKKIENNWVYSVNIMKDEFRLNVQISENNKITTELIEIETNEPYTLHLVDGLEGKFIGQVKQEYEKIIENFLQTCFEMNVFEQEQSIKVLEYAKDKYGSNAEYLWEKFPRNAVCRRKDNKKWYLAVLSVKQNRLGFEGEDIIEVLDIRAQKDCVSEFLKNPNIYPAYHMNKKSWITLILDGSIDTKEIFAMIDKSYDLAGK